MRVGYRMVREAQLLGNTVKLCADRLLVCFLPIFLAFGLSCSAEAAGSSISSQRERQISALDTGWKFARKDDYGAISADFDDKGWADVTLPHSFNGADGDDGDGYYRGPAWYRLTLP